MDNKYSLAAVQYVAIYPIRAGLSKCPEQYRRNSSVTYLSVKINPLVKVSALIKIIDDWPEFFKEGVEPELVETIRKHENPGRPICS